MCRASDVTSTMQRLNEKFPGGRCGYCNGTAVEKDENCGHDVIWCNDCDFHYTHIKSEFEDCFISTCDSCTSKICAACDNIGDCVKCEKSLCDDCANTFWCYECENGYCFECEELVAADDGTYCRPCAVNLDKEE